MGSDSQPNHALTLEDAERILGHTFKDRELLTRALTHASIAEKRLASNERLEFLGDAVLGMVVCDFLYRHFPGLLEGDLTKIKSAVVSRRMCAKVAMRTGLDRMLVLGKGMRTRSAMPPSLAAAVFESVIGALYLDAGMQAVERFLVPQLAQHIDAAAQSGHQQNFKSVLQQYSQSHLNEQPVYELIDEKGPDHSKCFEVRVAIGNRRFPTCWAPSKKQAEQQAALSALQELGLAVHNDQGEVVCLSVESNGKAKASKSKAATKAAEQGGEETLLEPVEADEPAPEADAADLELTEGP